METHVVHTFFGSGMAASSTIGEHKVKIDGSLDDGGTNTGPGPKRLMLTSLAGCTGIDIVSILNKMKVVFSELSIDTEAILSDEHPKIYKHVKILYKIKIAKADQPKMEKAVTLSAEKYCGVMAMFRSFATIESSIVYL
ncbi:MAG: OsmC family protein [Ferruginibacter sp.]